jgi:hypothetical protein
MMPQMVDAYYLHRSQENLDFLLRMVETRVSKESMTWNDINKIRDIIRFQQQIKSISDAMKYEAQMRIIYDSKS